MDLADCGSPERLIQAILKHHPHWGPPVPIEALAQSVNISELRELESGGFEGALVTDPDKTTGVIFYRAGRPKGRQRFTIGHELGHFLIPTHTGNQQCKSAGMSESSFKTPEQRRESEANRFAAGVLMPKPWFERDTGRLGDPDVVHVLELSRRYGTSFEATVNRYVELCGVPCAFVFSFNGKIRYLRRSQNFPVLSATPGQALPADSATVLKAPALLRTASAWCEVDGATWLQTDWGHRTPNLLEQSMRQANGYQVTLLILQDDGSSYDDDDDGDGDYAERWTPRF